MSDDAKFLRKVTIVNLMLNGASASSLGPSCGETTRTLISWMKAVDEKGFDSFRPKKQPGRPAKLTIEQKEEIKVAILSSLESSGYTIWDGPSLSDYINKSYGINLGVRQCQHLFHELGFSLIRPQAFPSKDQEDDPRRDVFKKTKRVFIRYGCSGCISG